MNALLLGLFLVVTPPERPHKASKRHFWHTETTSTPAAAVWEVWTDVARWPEFDSELSSASIETADGRLSAVGQAGALVDRNGRDLIYTVTQFEPGASYTFSTKLPGAELHVHHVLQQRPNGRLDVTHEVWFSGFLRGPFALLLGPSFRSVLPEVVREVIALAASTKSLTHE